MTTPGNRPRTARNAGGGPTTPDNPPTAVLGRLLAALARARGLTVAQAATQYLTDDERASL